MHHASGLHALLEADLDSQEEQPEKHAVAEASEPFNGGALGHGQLHAGGLQVEAQL